MASKKEVILLEELTSKIKAMLEMQAVLRDGLTDARKYLKVILERVEDMEATSEVMQLSLRRKIDGEELQDIKNKVLDIESRFTKVIY